MDLQDKAFPQAGHVTSAAAIIVFSRADGGKLTAADSAKVAVDHKGPGRQAHPEHRQRHGRAGVAEPPGADRDGRHAQRRGQRLRDAAADAVKALRADIKPLVAGTGLAEGVTGQAAQNLDSQQSCNRAEQIVLLATLAADPRYCC